MSISEDYWKIVKKATDALEAELEKLKAAKIYEIKKELLFDFLAMYDDYFDLKIKDIDWTKYGYKNEHRKMYDIGENLFYDNIRRNLYREIISGVLVHNYELPNDDKKIDLILKLIEQKHKQK